MTPERRVTKEVSSMFVLDIFWFVVQEGGTQQSMTIWLSWGGRDRTLRLLVRIPERKMLHGEGTSETCIGVPLSIGNEHQVAHVPWQNSTGLGNTATRELRAEWRLQKSHNAEDAGLPTTHVRETLLTILSIQLRPWKRHSSGEKNLSTRVRASLDLSLKSLESKPCK